MHCNKQTSNLLASMMERRTPYQSSDLSDICRNSGSLSGRGVSKDDAEMDKAGRKKQADGNGMTGAAPTPNEVSAVEKER